MTQLNDEVDEHGGILPEDLQAKRIKRYREILDSGKLECPIYVPANGSGKRGRVKQTKKRNLLDR